jgi:hypothetical protein
MSTLCTIFLPVSPPVSHSTHLSLTLYPPRPPFLSLSPSSPSSPPPAAVPSKRDMLALIKAIQSELGMAAAEGDGHGGLLRAVCREAVKAVQLVRQSNPNNSLQLYSLVPTYCFYLSFFLTPLLPFPLGLLDGE